MGFILFIILWSLFIIIFWLYSHYQPTLDYILDNKYYTIYLWYYKHNTDQKLIKRTYKVLFRIRKT